MVGEGGGLESLRDPMSASAASLADSLIRDATSSVPCKNPSTAVLLTDAATSVPSKNPPTLLSMLRFKGGGEGIVLADWEGCGALFLEPVGRAFFDSHGNLPPCFCSNAVNLSNLEGFVLVGLALAGGLASLDGWSVRRATSWIRRASEVLGLEVSRSSNG